MPLFKKDFSIWGQKERTIQIPPVIGAPPSPAIEAPLPPPPPPPQPSKRPVITYHSTLLLLEKRGLAQEPGSYWIGKQVEETPSSRNEKGRTVFDPESRARIAQRKLSRETRARKAERELRSLSEGWLEGPAQNVARALEELEDAHSEIRDVARWENTYLQAREQRKAQSRASWFGKESDKERECRLAVEAGQQSIRAPEWAREFEPQSPTQLESSAASFRSQKSHRRINSFSYTAPSVTPSDTRLSILSMTTQSTPRSSIMSTGQSVSTMSSPVSSGMPSPALGATNGNDKGEAWNNTVILPPTLVV